jgi:hypothetical protein
VQSSAAALSEAEGEGKMADSMSLSIFTMVVDHKPVIAFGCKEHSEAEAICADERIRAKLSAMSSGGKPLLDDFATWLVRLARPDERAAYYEQSASRSHDSGMLLVYLVDLDPSPA